MTVSKPPPELYEWLKRLREERDAAQDSGEFLGAVWVIPINIGKNATFYEDTDLLPLEWGPDGLPRTAKWALPEVWELHIPRRCDPPQAWLDAAARLKKEASDG